MSAKTLQKTLAVFSTCLALESSHKWFRHRRDHFRWAAAGSTECTVTCQWLLVCALLAQLRRREYTFQSRPLLVAALGQPCTVYSVAGVYTVPWGSHVQSVAARTKWWTGPQIKQPAKPLLLDFPSRLPPIEPVGWDAGRMGSKMRRRGLYSRSHVPLLSLPSGWAARFTLATTAQILNQKLMNCKFYGMLFRSLFSSSETCFEGELFIKWLVSLWFIARELPHLWPQPKVSNWKQIWFWVGEKSKVSQFRILGNLWKCCWLEQARASNVEKTSLLKATIWWNDDWWELYDEVGGCDKNCSTEVTHYIYEP